MREEGKKISKAKHVFHAVFFLVFFVGGPGLLIADPNIGFGAGFWLITGLFWFFASRVLGYWLYESKHGPISKENDNA